MTRSRLLATGLLCAALLTAAASARAATVWTPARYVSQPGAAATMPQIASTDDGRVAAVWLQVDGSDTRVVGAVKDPGDSSWTSPTFISPAGESAERIWLTTGTDGAITATWDNHDATPVLETQTLLARDTNWPDPTVIAPVSLLGPEGSLGPVTVATGPEGVATVTWSPTRTVRARSRVPGTRSWTAPLEISGDADTVYDIGTAFNHAGDGIAVWHTDYDLKFSRYDATTQTWSEQGVIASFDPYQGDIAAAIDDSLNVAVMYSISDGIHLRAATAGASGPWTVTGDLNPADAVGIGPAIAAVGNGRFAAIYQTIPLPDDYADSRVHTRDFDVGSGWSEQADVPGPMTFGGPPMLARNAHGDLALIAFGGVLVGDSPQYGTVVTRRLAGTAAWEPSTMAITEMPNPMVNLPVVALDGDGDLFSAFSGSGPNAGRIAVTAGDAAGPRVRSLSIPGSATAGAMLTFSVSAFDLVSALNATTWEFGDGTTAASADVSHAFAAAGTYTVTVTVTDATGHSTVRTGSVTVTATPAAGDDDQSGSTPAQDPTTDQPPTTDKQPTRPQPEVALNAKVLMLRAKIKLAAGRKCSGAIKATARVGKITYSTAVRLRRSGRDCLAVGTIPMRTKPRTAALVKVTFTGKRVRKRTLTARRPV